MTNLNETSFEETISKIDSYNDDKEKYEIDWLISESEEFCKNKAIENAIYSAVSIYDDPKKSNHLIEELIKKALSISFNIELGINYFDKKDIQKRYKKMTSNVKKIPCHIDEFNILCGGGIEQKAITVLIGDTHIGKTMSMVSLCAAYVRQGYNVLYVTYEMSQEKIAQFFDANFIKMEINDIPTMTYNQYENGVLNSRKEGYGNLVIKEYATGGTNDIRLFVNELKLKLDFKPQIICVDYLNLMKCDRFTDQNSYFIIKSITEELRALMKELSVAGLSASQLTRSGAGSSNPTMRDTAESYGLPQTVDCLIVMFTNEDLINKNIIIWKSLKNRFGGIVDYYFPIKANYEMATLENFNKEKDEGVVAIQNSERTKALMKKMKNKKQNIVNEYDVDSINSLFID